MLNEKYLLLRAQILLFSTNAGFLTWQKLSDGIYETKVGECRMTIAKEFLPIGRKQKNKLHWTLTISNGGQSQVYSHNEADWCCIGPNEVIYKAVEDACESAPAIVERDFWKAVINSFGIRI